MPALIRRSTGSGTTAELPPAPARSARVAGADGVPLHVEEHGNLDAPLTVVFAHGWALDSRTWDAQCADLPARLGAPVRMLTYDHRGHGRSGTTTRNAATLDRLGDDLAAVLRARAPEGPVVLAGHSMGGMTIMALAERHPQLFAERVAGLAFISTSCGGLDQVTYGLPAALAPWLRRVEDVVGRVMTARDASRGTTASPHDGQVAPVHEHGSARRPGDRVRVSVMRPGLRWLLFGEKPPPGALERTVASVAGTPPVSVVGFRDTLGHHDRAHALTPCARLPVVVACGTRDRMCPPPHARTLARSIPGSQLVLYPKAGHMLPMERADEITGHIASVARAAAHTVGEARREG